MKIFNKIFIVLLVMAAVMAGAPTTAPAATTVTLMTHDSFAMSEAVLKAFEQASGLKVRILKTGDAGAALSQAILSRKNPLADVFFGVDNTFMSRALKADIFEPYASPGLAGVPYKLRLDPTNRLLPVDFGDVCLNFDKAWFEAHKMTPPAGLADLIKPEYKGLTVVQNPATSSPGLAFLMTTIGAFGPDGWRDYWAKLRANDVYVSTGWSDAYYTQFSRAKGGTRPIVVSYASSPAAEVFFAETKPEQSSTGAVLTPASAFRQVEFVGLLKGAKEPEAARKLIDFMLSPAFQRDIPLNMWVFPAVTATPLPEVFTKHTGVAVEPVLLDPARIEAGREKWIEAWTETVLR